MIRSIPQRFNASGAGRWYTSRERSEQRVVLALVIAIAVVLGWLVLWKPISDWRALEANRYQNARSELEWVKANEGRAREIASSSSAGGERSLLPVITRSAEAQAIRISRLQPESNGSVSIVIQAQPFNELLRWLHQLNENNGVSVSRIAVSAEGRPGLVNAQVRLQ